MVYTRGVMRTKFGRGLVNDAIYWHGGHVTTKQQKHLMASRDPHPMILTI